MSESKQMDLDGELRLLRPKRGDVLALYVDIFKVVEAEELTRVLAELRRSGVIVLVLPEDAGLMTTGTRTVQAVLDEWVHPYGFRVVARAIHDATVARQTLTEALAEARGIARRLADEGRPMLGWTDGGLPLVRFIEAVAAFDALHW